MAPSAEAVQVEPSRAQKKADSLSTAISAAGTFPPNGPDPAARSWGHDAAGQTFAAQSKLPKQPIPSLLASCERYLHALEPLQSQEEQQASISATRRFIHSEGPILQAQLKAYDATHDNYFEHFCYQAFLGDNASVVYNSNAFCAFKSDPNPQRMSQIVRASALVRAAVAFSQAIREDKLPLDEVRGVPQCMNQYWWLFGVSKIPEQDGGRIRMDADARHIIVLCRGQMYPLNVLKEQSGEIVDEADLRRNLQDIVDHAQSLSGDQASRTALGVLTTENQQIWSRCRKLLVHDGLQNGRNLAIVDSSLFALCLDDSSPRSTSDICKNMICGANIAEDGVQVGSCLNRWYDKLAIIVCRNGAAGMNFEHTCSDGSVDIRMACEIYEGSISDEKDSEHVTPGTEPLNGLKNGTMPTKAAHSSGRQLQWDIPPEVQDALLLAQSHLSDRIEKHQLETLDIPNYGSTYIKSKRFSPDAFFQMTLQAAYFSEYKQIRSGFEPVVTRQYLHGRTDVSRTTTQEAAAFARAFSDEGASAVEKIEAMRRATEAHAVLSKTCAKGMSHHRHLYVLQQLWKRRRAFLEANKLDMEGEAASPNIFTDPGWSRLGTTILMGSNVENPSLAYAGFGPAADDGFTVCYYIRADCIAMSVTSRNGEAARFAKAIERTLGELKGMLNT